MSSNKYTVYFLFIFATNMVFITKEEVTDAKFDDWQTKLNTEFQKLLNILNPAGLQAIATYQERTYSSADAKAELTKIVNDIKTMTEQRANTVKALKSEAENKYKGHTVKTPPTCDNFVYNRAKAISNNPSQTAANITGQDRCQKYKYLALHTNPLLYNLEVNEMESTSHIPTNVYDGSKAILMVANWTKALDPKFKQHRTDTTLKWQYFGSREGLLRIFPGVKWFVQIKQIGSKYPVDFFDCRSLPWYIMAAACPKEIILLVDKSGSMTGKRQIIANLTITEILKSLTDNDFFNVIQMSSPKSKTTLNATIHFIDEKYKNETIPATLRNKHRIIDLLTLKPSGIAKYDQGLEASFKILKRSKNTHTDKAIIIIGDGAPDPYDQIFNTYNKDKSIRIFSYLIGKEATEVKNFKQMACSNNGFYAHIMTLSDVKENVLKYLPVMARAPNANGHIVWAGVHTREIMGKVPHVHEHIKYNATGNGTNVTISTTVYASPNVLFTSVAMAAYDKKTTSKNFIPLLGVAGVDVPILDFVRRTKQLSFGVFGYAFMINNNGFVLFHPYFRPKYKGHMKPYYQNTDIDSVEHPLDILVSNGFPEFNSTLRTDMINRVETEKQRSVYNIPDDFKSAINMDMKYFIKKVDNTPYSVALALRWQSDKSENCITNIPAVTTNEAVPNLQLYYADWLGKANCTAVNVSAEKYNVVIPKYEFCNFNAEVAHEFQHNPVCALKKVLTNVALLNSLACDKDFINHVQYDAKTSKDWHSTMKIEDAKTSKFGIDAIFMLFSSGLIKVYRMTPPPRDTNLTANHTKGMKDSLFQTTYLFEEAKKSKQEIYFHVPSVAEISNFAKENSTDFSVTATSMVYAKGKTLPVAVVGLQLSYNILNETVAKTTESGSTDSDVYLVSTNGYVVASRDNTSDVGKPLAVADPVLMTTLLGGVKYFIEKTVYDFQGICKYTRFAKSYATRLSDPFTIVIRSLTKMLHSLGMFVVQLCSAIYWAMFSAAEENPAYNVTDSPPWGSCGIRHSIYEFNYTHTTKQSGAFTCCNKKCSEKKWKAQIIGKTNLILLTVSPSRRACNCNCSSKITVIKELKINRTLMVEPYRKGPGWNCKNAPTKLQGGFCAFAGITRPSKFPIVLAVSLLMMRLLG